MADELLRLLCALAALGIPLAFAWLIVHLGARRRHRKPRHKPMR